MYWMRTDPRAEEVREIVREVFSELENGGRWAVVGGPWSENELDDIVETIRIGEGCCRCRCYAIDGFSAVWQVADGIVEFFDDQQRLLRRVNLFKKVRPMRMAA